MDAVEAIECINELGKNNHEMALCLLGFVKNQEELIGGLQQEIKELKRDKCISVEDLRTQFNRIYSGLINLPWDTAKEVEQLWTTYKCCATANGLLKPLPSAPKERK